MPPKVPNIMVTKLLAGLAFTCVVPLTSFAQAPLTERIVDTPQGRDFKPWQPTDEELANPWPKNWEQEYRSRREAAIKPFKGAANERTTDEHEKWGYPDNIGAWLAGQRDEAVAGLMAPDRQASQDHAHTEGIDLYWCFTLKGQARKWFDFGSLLSPPYQEQFKRAMKSWTASDPRPSLEYAGLLGTGSSELDSYLLAQLSKMWRDEAALKKMADEAEAEGHPNKKKFAEYIREHAATLGSKHPGTDRDAWIEWWSTIANGGWMVFEEYERRSNPNPHPKYGIGKGPVGGAWNPGTRGMRADARNTDNLRGMREVAAYLFAEQSGNEMIRELYKSRLKRTALSFWNVGNGEWDSSTYLGHTMSAYVNLYDFAKDPEVRGYAKAILDFLFASSAIKYRNGAWGSPQVRDYGDHAPWSTSALTSWLYFGGGAKKPPHKELEHALFFTSAYRPPAAVTALARKETELPVEIFASHPQYENFLPGRDEAPAYHETQYLGKHFQLGTMREGHGYNSNGFKLLADNDRYGVAFVIPTTGKLRNGVTNTAGGDVIVQNGPGALYFNPKKVPFHLAFPAEIPLTRDGSTLFMDFGNSWAAFIPVDLTWGTKNPMKKSKKSKGPARLVQHGEGHGFVVQVGEKGEYPSFDAFRESVNANTRVSVQNGEVIANFSNGRSLTLSEDGKVFERDGGIVDWDTERRDLWQPAKGGETPISLDWKQRRMVVEAGGHRFEAELKESGQYHSKSALGE